MIVGQLLTQFQIPSVLLSLPNYLNCDHLDWKLTSHLLRKKKAIATIAQNGITILLVVGNQWKQMKDKGTVISGDGLMVTHISIAKLTLQQGSHFD